MNALLTAITSLLPHRLIRAAIVRQRFHDFAETNGLVYFGAVSLEDEHESVRGFTAHTNQSDNYVSHGTIGGHDVSLLQRTVGHKDLVGKAHGHTWLIAAVACETSLPHVLMLSHVHSRLHEEAAYLHQNRSEHVAIEYRLDAQFLIYARREDVETIRKVLAGPVIEYMLANPQYDYELDGATLHLYSQELLPTEMTLNRILKSGLTIADSIDSLD